MPILTNIGNISQKLLKDLLLHKRIFAVGALVMLGIFIVKIQRNNFDDQGIKSPVLTKAFKVTDYDSQIKGDNKWKPVGYGDGQWLTDLPIIKAGAVIDFDSGNVIWSDNLKSTVAPASLTKIASVMTALDLQNPDQLITVSQKAADQIPTKIGLRANEKLSLGEAVAASIMTSANDAAEAIADDVGKTLGGENNFMALVNSKLKKIGATSSNFVNPTGLDDPNHFSTVYDLAIMAHFAKINYPVIASFASLDYKRLEANSNHKLFDLPNWNALLGTYPGVDGLKIGFTENAGYATIVTSQRNGKKLMAIVVGAGSIEDREKAAATLLNKGFETEGVDPYAVTALNLTKRFEDWRRQLTLGPNDVYNPNWYQEIEAASYTYQRPTYKKALVSYK